MHWTEHLGCFRNCSSVPGRAQPLGSSDSLAIPPTAPLQLMPSSPPNWHISQWFSECCRAFGRMWLNTVIQLQNLELSLWLQQGRSTLKLCSGTNNHFSHWFIKHTDSHQHRSQLPVPSFISARLLCEFLPGFPSKETLKDEAVMKALLGWHLPFSAYRRIRHFLLFC